MLRDKFNNIDVRDYKALHPELFAYVREQMARSDKDYLLIGDTNHVSPKIRGFLTSPALAALFKYAGIPHVCVEIAREHLPPGEIARYRQAIERAEPSRLPKLHLKLQENLMYARATGRYLRNLFNSHSLVTKSMLAVTMAGLAPVYPSLAVAYAAFCVTLPFFFMKIMFSGCTAGFTRAGLQVTAADSAQWSKMPMRMFLGEREVADYIRRQRTETGHKKTAVIYGDGHLMYGDSLIGYLGRENALYIAIYKSRESYRRQLNFFRCDTEMMPDKVYFLKERTLENPDPALYSFPDRKQEDFHFIRRRQISRQFGEAASSITKGQAIAAIRKLPHIDPEYFNYRPPERR